jgi:hypothetical protein
MASGSMPLGLECITNFAKFAMLTKAAHPCAEGALFLRENPFQRSS